jgi:glycosyltransferase involved in cell wall biosynthesis
MNPSFVGAKVLFAPDWREGNPYQELLAAALNAPGTRVDFASNYRRGLPLARLTWQLRPDILHIHWPEAYCLRGDRLDALRVRRLPVDVRLASVTSPVVITGHNLFPHNTDPRGALGRAITAVHRCAAAVIAHSDEARTAVCETHGLDPAKVFVIPHGDLSESHGKLPDRRAARHALSLPENKTLCLMFGRVEAYKGIDEIVDFWNAARPTAELCIVGFNGGGPYGTRLMERIRGNPSIRPVFRQVTDPELTCWLAAADCAIFNYTALLTSGAASLARSCGVPLLLPSRLTTVDVGEPDPRVFRFSDVAQLSDLLPKAASAGTNYESAGAWRRATDWKVIAERTREVYHRLLSAKVCVE